MKSYLLRGVPRSLQMDGWWLAAPAAGAPTAPPPPPPLPAARAAPGRGAWRLLALVALIALADRLFWDHAPGLSLAVFGLAVAGALMGLTGRRPTRREVLGGAVILVAGTAPVVEHVQMLSVLFYAGGLALLAGWVALMGQGGAVPVLHAAGRFMLHAPAQPLRDLRAGDLARISDRDWAALFARLARAWALPAGAGLVFVALLLLGNPIYEYWAVSVPLPEWDPETALLRATLWSVVGFLVWPFLALTGLSARLTAPIRFGALPAFPAGARIVNATSVTNSLIAFNLLFALQTGLDLTYLWAGADLPAGMSHAEYAHRGAYPLVATALLAGLFALIARPYAGDRRGLKLLLGLWLAQNLALVASSVLRLDLYVQGFGLTYLRFAAFIWMGLVAAGLALIGWQIARGRSNGWMLVRLAALLVGVLYACCFVNFANLIAGHNLSRMTRGIGELDSHYICRLGPMALPAITDYEARTGQALCAPGWQPPVPAAATWREWGFRGWRVQRYLGGAGPGQEGHDERQDTGRR